MTVEVYRCIRLRTMFLLLLLGRISDRFPKHKAKKRKKEGKKEREKESIDYVHSSLTKSNSSNVVYYHVGPVMMDSRSHVCVSLEAMEIDDENEISTEEKQTSKARRGCEGRLRNLSWRLLHARFPPTAAFVALHRVQLCVVLADGFAQRSRRES